MNILLFGKGGQVGWELQRSLAVLGHVTALDHDSTEHCGDFSNPAGLADTVRALRPDIIVNAAAHTAVDKAEGYYESIWAEDSHAVPRFLWNAKMRFGKTFASYQLAKRLGAKRILVVTFKPAVEDAWQTDLESHADFDGWQYLSSVTGVSPGDADKTRPLVYFGSFQDLLGRDRKTGLIKAKNGWIHTTNWDLVIFDEYHFGAWRESAKELFEGEDERVKQKELAAEYPYKRASLPVNAPVQAQPGATDVAATKKAA